MSLISPLFKAKAAFSNSSELVLPRVMGASSPPFGAEIWSSEFSPASFTKSSPLRKRCRMDSALERAISFWPFLLLSWLQSVYAAPLSAQAA